MTEEEIVVIILEELGVCLEREVDDLRRELEAIGPRLPIDSLILAEVVSAVEDRLGLSLPMDITSARSMGAVRDLANRLGAVAADVEAGRATA